MQVPNPLLELIYTGPIQVQGCVLLLFRTKIPLGAKVCYAPLSRVPGAVSENSGNLLQVSGLCHQNRIDSSG